MSVCLQAFLAAFSLAIPQGASSFHGASLQVPRSTSDAEGQVTVPEPVPQQGHHPTESLALHQRWATVWAESERPPALKQGGIFAQPMAVKDKHIVALPELKIQRFGHKCDEGDEAAKVAAVTTTTQGTFAVAPAADMHKPGLADPPRFFQIDSVQETNASAAPRRAADPVVMMQHDVASVGGTKHGSDTVDSTASRQVGEVALQDNVTAPNSGFAAASMVAMPLSAEENGKRPDSLEVGVVDTSPQAMPSVPKSTDSLGGEHIHVASNIVIQEVGTLGKSSGGVAAPAPVAVAAPPSSVNHTHVTANVATQVAAADVAPKAPVDDTANISWEEEAAWNNFTMAEALEESRRGKSQAEAVKVLPSLPPHAIVAHFGSPSQGFFFRHRISLVITLLVIIAAIMGGMCLVTGFMASFLWHRQLASPIGAEVDALPICDAAEVERKLPVSGGYDCIFSKPLSSCELLRLEARIEGPAAGNAGLKAPLTDQACVLYSAAVSRHLHDGIPPVPVAFASASVDFVISLKDAPHIRIDLRGEDVSLFDVGRGRCVQRQTFATAPDRWQDFILTHRAAAPGNDWQTSSQLRADNAALEFQECALLVGVVATFVGELHRGADGTLSLKPLQHDSYSADMSGTPRDVSERWRTSWELGGCEASNVASHPATPRDGEESKAHFEKVLASDDARLLESCSDAWFGSTTILLRRLPAKCSSWALAFIRAHRRKAASSKRSAAALGS